MFFVGLATNPDNKNLVVPDAASEIVLPGAFWVIAPQCTSALAATTVER
jgi:hypothetical protein